MREKKDKVSVIIPMYNARNTILKALNSVINQTYKVVFEIIVINDGSKDGSSEIVADFIIHNQGEIEILLINKQNGGVSSARNVGLMRARGNWIALLDSDDEWLPNKLQRQFDILKLNPEIDFLGTTRNSERINRIFCKKFSKLTKITTKNLLLRFVFVVPTVLFKREILDDVGYFDETLKYAEEGNYFLRIASKYNCYLLNESLAITGGGKAHFGESGLSGNIREMERGELRNIKFAFLKGWINLIEYLFITFFSLLKYLRRVIIVNKTR